MKKEKLPLCPTSVIRDTPSDCDEFSSQSHERIAKTIVDMIKNEKGGITIGIEGDYGSGKSTIINLIKRDLFKEKPKNLKFLLFDAWAHEGNLLRMIFLQRTIKELMKGQNETNWFKCPKEGKKLLNQIENGQVNNIKPKNVWLVYFCTILFLLLPTSVTLLTKGLQDGLVLFTDPNGEAVNINLLLGSILIFLLLLLSAISYFKHKDDFLEIMISKKINDNKREVSSVEYDKWFIDTLIQTLRKDRTFIIVIDNLDRISAERRLSFLSTLQTFLQYCHSSDQKYKELIKNHLWVIIPYNKSYIEEKEIANSDINEIQLLEKTINSHFYVPKLLTSNWGEFLRKRLIEAFPKHSDDETIETIISICKDLIYNKPPQPRQIISLVNDIGNLHRQWCPIIPLTHIAYYVLINNNPGEDINDDTLRNRKYPTDHYSSILNFPDHNLHDSVLCLYFNAPIEEARQLLLNGDIRSYLINGDDSKLKKLITNNPGSIDECIDTVLTELSKEKQSIHSINNIVRTLDKNSAFESNLAHKKYSSIILIGEMIKKSPVEVKLDEDICKKASYLIKFFSGDKVTINNIIKTINPKPNQESEGGKPNTAEDIISTAKGFMLLVKSLEEHPPSQDGIQIYIKTTEDRFFEFLQYVYSESKLQYINYIDYSADTEPDVQPNFSEVVSLSSYVEPPFSQNILGAFQILDKLGFNYDKNILGSKLSTRIISELEVEIPNETYKDSTNNLLDAILELYTSNRDVFLNFINEVGRHADGLIIRAIEKNYEKEDYKNAARWLYLEFRCFPRELAFNSPNIKGYNKNFLENSSDLKEENLIKVISELRIFFETSDFEIIPWFNIISVLPNNSKLLYLIMNEFKAIEKKRFDIDLDWIYTNWEVFRKRSDTEEWKIKLIKLLSNDYLIEDEIMQRDFEFDQSQFFAHLLEFNYKKGFAEYCKTALTLLSKEDWDQYFITQHSVFLILFYLNRRNDITPALTDNFQKSYIEFAAKFIKGEVKIKYHDHWPLLYKSLNQHKRNSTCDEIFKIIEERNGDIPIDFFDYYGPLLIHERALRARDCKFMRIFTPIIRKSNEKHIKWVLEVFEECNFKKIATDDSDTIHEFVDEIKIKIEDESTPKEIWDLLNEIYEKVDASYKTENIDE